MIAISEDNLMDNSVDEAIDKAIIYLSYRPHSIKEIKVKLAKRDFSRDTIDEAVEILKSKNYINEVDYAMAYIRNAMSKKKSLFRIKNELISKGLSSNDIQTAINNMNEEGTFHYSLDGGVFSSSIMDTEKENALNEATRIYEREINKKNINLADYSDRHKVKEKIARRLSYLGYSTSTVISTVEQVVNLKA